MTARSFLLLAAVASPLHAAGAQEVSTPPDAPPPRLAGLVSRDARLFLWSEDRDAFLRRARRTAVVEQLALADRDLLADVTAGASAQIGALLPEDIAAALPDVFRSGRGAVAVAIEGFALDGESVAPDAVLVAETDAFADIDPTQWVQQQPYRGVEILTFTTHAGRSGALASWNGLMIVSRTAARVQQALDRGMDGNVGSLLDNTRFVDVWRRTAPRPGSAFVFADLQRLRQETPWLAGSGGGWERFLVEGLGAFDGLGIAVRGAGIVFEGRVVLELGAEVAGGADHPLMRRASRFEFPAFVGGDATALLAARLELDEALTLLRPASIVGGGLGVTGTEADGALLDAARRGLGGEFAVWIDGGTHLGEFNPRLAMLLEARDPAAVAAAFERAAERTPDVVRGMTIAGTRAFTLALPDNGVLSAPCFALVDRWLVGTSNFLVLRDLLDERRAGAPRLREADAFLDPLDRMDIAPDAAGCAALFVDSRTLARSALQWVTGLRRTMPSGFDDDMDARAEALVELLDDPDLQEGLGRAAAWVTPSPTGITIDFTGP